MLSGPTIFKQHCLADVTFIKVSMKIIKNLKTSFEKKSCSTFDFQFQREDKYCRSILMKKYQTIKILGQT